MRLDESRKRRGDAGEGQKEVVPVTARGASGADESTYLKLDEGKFGGKEGVGDEPVDLGSNPIAVLPSHSDPAPLGGTATWTDPFNRACGDLRPIVGVE